MTTSVWLYQLVFVHEVVSARICPVLVTTSAAVEQQQRFAFPFDLVMQFDVIE